MSIKTFRSDSPFSLLSIEDVLLQGELQAERDLSTHQILSVTRSFDLLSVDAQIVLPVQDQFSWISHFLYVLSQSPLLQLLPLHITILNKFNMTLQGSVRLYLTCRDYIDLPRYSPMLPLSSTSTKTIPVGRSFPWRTPTVR